MLALLWCLTMTNDAAWALERMPDSAAWSKNELSQSKMKDLIDCSYKYWLLRKEKIKNRKVPSASLPMGTAFHNAVEVYHNSLRKGFEPDIDLIMDIVHSTFHEEYNGHVSDSSMGYAKYEVPKDVPLDQIDGAMERAVKNVQFWVNEYIVAHQNGELPLMDRIEVGCEVDYRRFFPELGIYLRGKLDIVFNEKEIGDWKTMNQNKQWQFCTERADGEIQADWYAAILLGDEEGEVVFHYVCVEKVPHPDYQKPPKLKKDGTPYANAAPYPRKPKVEVVSTTRTQADVKNLMERVKLALLISDMLNDHQDGFFVRNPKGSGYEYCTVMCDAKDECYKRLKAEREGAKA